MLTRVAGAHCLTCVWLLCSAACGARAPSADQQQPAVELAKQHTAVVAEQQLRSATSIAGTLQPRDQATIAAQLVGVVRDVRVALADHVERGQVLARLDVSGTRGCTHAPCTRARDPQCSPELAKREPASAQQPLCETTIRAPISGVVSARSVDDGDVVRPGSPLFTIIDPSSLRLETSVRPDVLDQLTVGSLVTFHVHGQHETLEGKVTRIAPSADPTTGQVDVLVSIPNKGDRVLAGLFVEGWVYTAHATALAVPLSAVDFTQHTPTVTILRAGHVERVSVQLGITDEEQKLVQVRSGVKAGERVVTGPDRSIAVGTPVRLIASTLADSASAKAKTPSSSASPSPPRFSVPSAAR